MQKFRERLLYRAGGKTPPFTTLQKLAEYVTSLDVNFIDPAHSYRPIPPGIDGEDVVRELARVTDAVVFCKGSCILVRK